MSSTLSRRVIRRFWHCVDEVEDVLRGRPGKLPIPRLRTSPEPGPRPVAYFLCPDWDAPSGGVRMLHRHVDLLGAAGLPAAVLHRRPGFTCSWFEHDTRIVYAPQVVLRAGDVLVVPEMYGESLRRVPGFVRKVIFNQNAYNTFLGAALDGPDPAGPYFDNSGLEAVLVVSEDSAGYLRHAFPGVRVERIRVGLDPALHHPPTTPAGRRIAYMPRKRAGEAVQVLGILRSRGALRGWTVVPIQGKTEAETAEILRASSVFLSFSSQEGFGLPPAEAMACGCVVVGFHGHGGREFFRDEFSTAVEDGDVVGFARAVEDILRRFDEEPAAMRVAGQEASRFVLERYSRDHERADVLRVFTPLLDQAEAPAGAPAGAPAEAAAG